MKIEFNKSYEKKEKLSLPLFLKNNLPSFLKNNFIKQIYSFFYKLINKRDSQLINSKLNNIFNYLYHLEKKRNMELNEIKYDLSLLTNRYTHEKKIELIAKSEIAESSPDHLHPTGTMEDETRSPMFVTKVMDIFNRKLNYLDLGCSSGGLVFDFLEKGNLAIGIEGSDFSKKSQRSFWKIISNNLFVADISKKFEIKVGNERLKFDCITAFEVLEHIETKSLDLLIENIDNHLSDNGIFLGSIGTKPSYSSNGVPLHLTIWSPEKWVDYLCNRFQPNPNLDFNFHEFPRGTGNGYRDPDFRVTPIGFYFSFKKKK